MSTARQRQISESRRKCVAPEPVINEPMWTADVEMARDDVGGIYVCLTVAYFAASTFLSRVPPPYKLREIPKDLTPWLKK